MVGQVKRMTDDNRWFSYVESLFNENSGLKTHEMFSVCTPSAKNAEIAPAAPQCQILSRARRQRRVWYPRSRRKRTHAMASNSAA